MERKEQSLAQRVKLKRQELGLTQGQLAKLSGLKQPDVSKIELGRIEKTTGIARLAQALEVSVQWLETGEGSPETSQVEGQHRLVAQLTKIQAEMADDVLKSDPESPSHYPLSLDERQLIAAFRFLPLDDQQHLLRDVLAKSEKYKQLVVRELKRHGYDLYEHTASWMSPEEHAPQSSSREKRETSTSMQKPLRRKVIDESNLPTESKGKPRGHES